MVADRPPGVVLPEKSKVKVVWKVDKAPAARLVEVLSEPPPDMYGETLSGSVRRFKVVTVLLNLTESKLWVPDQLTVMLLIGRGTPTLLVNIQLTRSLVTVPSVAVRLADVQL